MDGAGWSNEPWKDVPDDVLEQLYRDLGSGDFGSLDAYSFNADGEDSMDMGGSALEGSGSMSAASSGEHTLRNSAFFGGGDAVSGGSVGGGTEKGSGAAGTMFMSGRTNTSGDLPPLFQTSSFTNVATIPPVSAFSAAPRQVRPELQKAREMLQQLTQMERQQDGQIEKLRSMQQQLLNTAASGDTGPEVMQRAHELRDQQWSANQQLELEMRELLNIQQSVVLDAAELHQSRVLGMQLATQQSRLEVLRRELHHYASGLHGQPCFAMLAIQDQPTPQVIFKNKVIDDTYAVRLVSPSRDDIMSMTMVKASLISEEQIAKNVDNQMSNDEATIDAFERVATFENMKVHVSTRMSMVNVKFQLQVQLHNGQVCAIESDATYPIIVITNESQWCDAAAKLLIGESFMDEREISWPHFANTLHRHFLKATRQNPACPLRPMRLSEFEYIHTRLFRGAQTIDQEAAAKCWKWFGPVTQTLRFKRHVHNLWFQGLIYGIMTKQECTQYLQMHEVGTFMIRFSESFPGLFAVGYVSDDPMDRVKHYLVRPEDTGSQKTLPDFLREKQQFKYLLQLDVVSGTLSKYEKNDVFSPYYLKSKRIAGTASSGYVLL